MRKYVFIIGTIFLFIISAMTLIVVGYDIKIYEKESIYEDYNRYYYPEYYDYYSVNKISVFIEYKKNEEKINCKPRILKNSRIALTQSLQSIIDSAWMMYCHDSRHTGRSPYSTAENPGIEKWNFKCKDWVESSPVIDADGYIYFSAFDDYLYSLYPNGTLRWKHDIGQRWTQISPAIDEYGIIYIGTSFSPSGGDRFFAINPDGTRKWTISTGQIFSSPVIGEDGTIYFGSSPGYINAVNTNGTMKWKYKTGHVIYSSPAIGLDGTIYCGSHDNYIYALYPNGTLRWKFDTGNWVHGSPSIADDGTVYCGSDNGYLYAFYPNNGTLKWKLSVGSMLASPALDKDGILYFGVWNYRFYAVNPNGTIKWKFDPGEKSGIWGSSAAISDDGTIYFGTCVDVGYTKGGDIIALNPDGTEKWRKRISNLYIVSSPCISEDGTIFIGSALEDANGIVTDYGYLHAFGKLDHNAPFAPDIYGPTSGKEKKELKFNFTSTSPLDRAVYYYVDWGDNKFTEWTGPSESGEEISLKHTWTKLGTYIIKSRAKDTDNLWGPWGEFEIKITKPRIREWLNFIDIFPILQKILNYIL